MSERKHMQFPITRKLDMCCIRTKNSTRKRVTTFILPITFALLFTGHKCATRHTISVRTCENPMLTERALVICVHRALLSASMHSTTIQASLFQIRHNFFQTQQIRGIVFNARQIWRFDVKIRVSTQVRSTHHRRKRLGAGFVLKTVCLLNAVS